MPLATFDSARAPKWTLITIDYRPPKRGELYISTHGTIQRVPNNITHAPRKQPRAIVLEDWTTGPQFDLATYSRPPKQ